MSETKQENEMNGLKILQQATAKIKENRSQEA